MDAVGAVLAEREKEPFPWGIGAALAFLLHAGLVGAVLVSSLARPVRFASTRAVAVRLLSAGSITGGASRPARVAEAARPRIEKPREEPPPPPSEKAVLLPKREDKKKPTPGPPGRTAPRAEGPDVSLPAASESHAAGGTSAGPAGSGGTAGIGGATFDQPDFKYSYYIERMVFAIATNWFKPAEKITTNPVIRFRIERDGTVVDPEIERSSGLPFVDRAALRAVLASSPLPPLPTEYAGGHLGVHLVFE